MEHELLEAQAVMNNACVDDLLHIWAISTIRELLYVAHQVHPHLFFSLIVEFENVYQIAPVCGESKIVIISSIDHFLVKLWFVSITTDDLAFFTDVRSCSTVFVDNCSALVGR